MDKYEKLVNRSPSMSTILIPGTRLILGPVLGSLVGAPVVLGLAVGALVGAKVGLAVGIPNDWM